MGGERIAKYFEIFRFKVTRVFGNLVEIGINTPFTNFMADDRHIVFRDIIPVIGAGLRWQSINARFQPLAPALDAWIGSHMELVFRKLRPAGPAGVKASGIGGFPVG